MARPSKLSAERSTKIVGMISSGAYATVAAQANGIGETTYFRWMTRGRDAQRDEYGELTNADDEPYVDFFEKVKDAEAKAEVLNIGLIQRAATGGTWQAAAWYLERKYPDRWGRKDHLRSIVSGPEGGPIQVDAKEQLLAFLNAERVSEPSEIDAAAEPAALEAAPAT